MSRTKKFLYNSFTTALLQIVTLITGFIIPRLMLTSYGSEINGLVSSISQFISYFNLAEAGLASAAIYALYKPLADKDYDSVNGVVSAAKRFYILSGYIFVSLTIGLAIIYPFIVKSTKVNPIGVCLLVLVIGTAGALEFFTLSKYRVLLSADQKIGVISITSIIAIVLNTVIIAVLATLKVDIILLRFVAIFSVFARSIILWGYVKLKYKYINYKAKPNNAALNKRWDALFLQVLGTVQSATPVVIATIFTSLKEVSVYTIFNMVIGGISSILSIFISGLGASFGNVIAKKQQTTLQNSYQEFELIYYSLISWIYSCAFILIMPFIKIYTSGIKDANYNLPIVGFLFVLNGLLYNIKTPQAMIVFSAGLYKETRVQTTIQGAIAVVGGVVLAMFWGLPGILLGSILSNLYRDIDLMFFAPHMVTKLRVRKSFFRIIRIFITVTLIILPILYIKISPRSYLEWIINAVVIAIYALVVVVIINVIFDRKIFRDVINRVKLVLREIKA